jgi:hypothetical protein
VASVLFASTGPVAPLAGRAFRVSFNDGAVLTEPNVTLASGRLTLKTIDGAVKTLSADELRSIEQVNGPVRWLSMLKPTVNEQVSFSPDQSWPARMDRSVIGQPITFGDRVYDRGIGVHADSRLAFALDGTHKYFRVRYAIDAVHNAGRADLNVRILLDDKPAYVKDGVRAGELSPVIGIDVGDARTLTLMVTHADATGTQGRLNWIEPALLLKAPPPEPPTATQAVTKPAETSPATKMAQTKPAQINSAQTKPAATKPAPAKPASAKPAPARSPATAVHP